MKLGTKLTLYLSLIIVVVLSGVGYFHIQSRKNILNRKMKVAVRSIGQTMKVSLEKSALLDDSEYVQELIDSIEKYEKTVGVLVYRQGNGDGSSLSEGRTNRNRIEGFFFLS